MPRGFFFPDRRVSQPPWNNIHLGMPTSAPPTTAPWHGYPQPLRAGRRPQSVVGMSLGAEDFARGLAAASLIPIGGGVSVGVELGGGSVLDVTPGFPPVSLSTNTNTHTHTHTNIMGMDVGMGTVGTP